MLKDGETVNHTAHQDNGRRHRQNTSEYKDTAQPLLLEHLKERRFQSNQAMAAAGEKPTFPFFSIGPQCGYDSVCSLCKPTCSTWKRVVMADWSCHCFLTLSVALSCNLSKFCLQYFEFIIRNSSVG